MHQFEHTSQGVGKSHCSSLILDAGYSHNVRRQDSRQSLYAAQPSRLKKPAPKYQTMQSYALLAPMSSVIAC
jgi:hypothetical protein